jgi:hypothetical protein
MNPRVYPLAPAWGFYDKENNLLFTGSDRWEYE